MLDYSMGEVDALPAQVVESFAGVNDPFSIGTLRPGERVLDIGSRVGFDAILAARMVGQEGRVTGIDMTQAVFPFVMARGWLEAGDEPTILLENEAVYLMKDAIAKD